MTFKQLMECYDNGNGIIKVNNNYAITLVRCKAVELMFPCSAAMETKRNELWATEVISFGFHDDELCVKVK